MIKKGIISVEGQIPAKLFFEQNHTELITKTGSEYECYQYHDYHFPILMVCYKFTISQEIF